MKIKSTELLEDLKQKTIQILKEARFYQSLEASVLNNKPAPSKWSVLECIEHLNICGDIYLKEIESRLLKSNHSSQEYHKSGILGNYSAKSMLPKKDKFPMKMKTFKFMTPDRSNLTITTIDKFVKQQEHFLLLIEKGHQINLTKTKCGLAVKGLKFRMGDAMRFYAFHNVRHITQANKLLGRESDF